MVLNLLVIMEDILIEMWLIGQGTMTRDVFTLYNSYEVKWVLALEKTFALHKTMCKIVIYAKGYMGYWSKLWLSRNQGTWLNPQKDLHKVGIQYHFRCYSWTQPLPILHLYSRLTRCFDCFCQLSSMIFSSKTTISHSFSFVQGEHRS
jgi:hypothetical protein